MKATLILICILSTLSNILAIDIYAEYSWELIKDTNLNGWVDEGDVIRNRVEVTVYSKKEESIKITNNPNTHLSLIPSTVLIESGKVIYGNNPNDTKIEVSDIKIAEPWGITTVSFDSEVINSATLTDRSITNFATVIHSSGTVNSNEVHIPLFSKVAEAKTDKVMFYSSISKMILLLLLGLVAGFLSNRISFFKVSLPT